MYKKFTLEESVHSHSKAKSSLARGIRKSIVEQYPALEPYMEDILPKKGDLFIGKCRDRTSLIANHELEILFSQDRDKILFPHLKLLHKYPFLMTRWEVDKGAIKFVLSGANIMCRGLTSPGANIEHNLEAGMPVGIFAEGKEHALAVGQTTMSRDEIVATNEGIGVNVITYINDGLYDVTHFEQY
eukprot:TRINITY_DN781987_c0_g1_i1.p1 TRINITY_DN781987_c0_g1~~TRINITY_DN781987_c0_g1_i1.p1  ORF type:complete len:186 (+),score=35.26 TRINITY_DN781987_c0_g1_i1:117-674(+)